ncbi:TPA: DEAD/DEAH box helicase [Staphylococcus pseudintermedius]|nr:DEAD/DEAH box helicase [Staphylococcus pseudintermedius]
MDHLLDDFKNSLHKGFIDRSIEKQGHFLPKLLINNAQENVLATIIDELYRCESFSISVAFVTESGLASLKTHLYELKLKGVRGRILTSNYLSFNSPKMYEELMKLENVDVRVTNVNGFHAKGYIFDHDYYTSMIVGSSNLTSHALKVNYEHNIMFSSHRNGDIVHKVKNQFEQLWEASEPLTASWIESYRKLYQPKTRQAIFEVEQAQIEKQRQLQSAQAIIPNMMQQEALRELEMIRQQGESRGLIISATGTGKTIMSALDVRQVQPEKFLFVVHNEGILRRAMEDYRRVLADEPADAFGLLTGNDKQTTAKYLFSTIQTISKPDIYEQFSREHFDYIVFDEAHRVAAASYRRVFNYFTPEFILGMTATPERNDTLNIFELFHYNIAYEIRLQAALENDILCPFHYFGVTDYEVDGIISDDTISLQKLASDARVQHIIERTEYYGYSGDQLKGLIFVSRKNEAHALAEKLSAFGYPSVALTGDDAQQRRAEVIAQLRLGELNYIITVDLFNEGIDIPEVNQVVMLRATTSSIIFVQQLGRGLRKSSNKEYVTVIDFIGNYKNNYLIPIALSGDPSYHKDNYRQFLTNPAVLNGVSTINFEEVAKKQIFESLTKATLNSVKILDDAYENVARRIGRQPLLMDFNDQNAIDPLIILEKYKNYHEFLEKRGYTTEVLEPDAFKNLTFLSREVAPGLKNTEHFILQRLIEGDARIAELLEHMQQIDSSVTVADIETTLKILDFSYFKNDIEKSYGPPVIHRQGDVIELAAHFQHQLKNERFQRYVEDIIRLGQYNNEMKFEGQNEFIRYQKYFRKDFVKIMNWDKDVSSTIYGYQVRHHMVPIFVTYHKQEDITTSTQYGDTFISQSEFKWYTRSNRSLKSSEVDDIVHHQARNIPLYLFVKKEDAEGKNFYYLGRVHVIEGTVEETTMKSGEPVVTMHFNLETPVRDDIYRYIVEH